MLVIGPPPALRTLDNGKEVAYIPWRNGQVSSTDGRWDTTMGEMVLDGSTVSGYQAGDLRFVSSQFIPTDETGTITAAGDFVFHSHWLVMASSDLGDRSGGGSYNNAMGEIGPYVIWAQASGHGCSFNAATRWCSSLFTQSDTRNFGSGFYILYNDPERWLTSNDPYAFNYGPYVVASDGLLIVKSIDGAIFVLEYEQKGEDDPDLSLSTKTASTATPDLGDTVTYTIVLRNSGGPLDEETTVTDDIPSGIRYVTNSATASMGTVTYENGTVRWSGVLGSASTAAITYQATITAATLTVIENTAVIDSGSFGTLTRSATILANGFSVYLPIVLKNYQH